MSNLSRRSFLKRLGVGSAAVVAAPLVASLPAATESTKPLVIDASKATLKSVSFCPSSIAGTSIIRMARLDSTGSPVRNAFPTLQAAREHVEFL